MIYNSIDTIPMKVYLMVETSGHLQFLVNDQNKEDIPTTQEEMDLQESELKLIWEHISAEAEKYSTNKESKKILNLSTKVEALSARNESVQLAVHYLKTLYDEDLIEMLQGFGYRFKHKNMKNETPRAIERQFNRDVEKVEREMIALEIRLEQFRKKLPVIDEDQKLTPFDQTVMSYSAFTKLGFIDTNEITFTQYHSLIANGNEMMTAMEKNNRNGK